MVEPEELQKRRAAARRTALGLGVVVLLVYAMFLLSGVTGQ